MTGDVFEKDPSWLDLADDAGDIWPQVALVVFALALPCVTERLARIACEDGVDGSPERSPVEGGDIIPDRCGSEVSGPLRGDDGLSGILLPLDKATGVESRLGEHEAHIEATGSGAEG